MKRFGPVAAAFVAGALVLALSGVAALADKRVALVLGNSSYQNAAPLPNPVNDADAVAQMFKKAGYEVSLLKDVGSVEFKRELRKFENAANSADIAVVFYAGHAIEIGGTNYMLPVDAKLATDRDARDEAIELERIVEAVEPAKRLRLVIVDACRDNPFLTRMKRRRQALSRATAGVGLGPAPDLGSEILIAYAAKQGETADDGDGEHSPFTTAILHNLTQPGVDVRIAFGRVRDEVLKITSNRQEPFVYGSLGGDIISLVPAPERPRDQDNRAQQDDRTKQDYDIVMNAYQRRNDKNPLLIFLKQHPTGFYSDLIRNELNQFELASITQRPATQVPRGSPDDLVWDQIKGGTDPEAFLRFMKNYPNSPNALEAQHRLDILRAIAREREEDERRMKAEAEAAAKQQKAEAEAFVSAPGTPPPNSEGAGVWVRNVGGDLNVKSSTQVNGSLGAAAIPGLITINQGNGTTNCNSTYHQTFAGFQLGQDLARLNLGGWNLHLGTTAGFLETSGKINQGNINGGAFNSTTQAPFLGTYGVLTRGDFYIDGLIRFDYFQTELNSPTANIFDQKVDAHGLTLAASTGYNYKVPNSKWFVEPSLGVVWSKESVGPISVASPIAAQAVEGIAFPAGNYSGTTQVSDIDTLIGRAGVRVGTTVETGNLVLQPFVAASVWHDFSGDITAHYFSCPNCLLPLPNVLAANLTTNNIGTFGQYSLGVSGQVVNTGWLGFVRVDYREGPNMNGFSGTGGFRYQFTPSKPPAYPVKAPVYRAPDVVNWAGLYVGAIGGVESGRSDMYFSNSGAGTGGIFGFPLFNLTSAGGSAANLRPAGALGGGTLGYNWQLGSWVYGIEGDAAGMGVQGSMQCQPLSPPGQVNNSLFQSSCHNEIDWTATIAGRLGYAWLPHTLIYGKAGVAIAEESFSETCNLGPINGTNGGGFFQNCVNASGAFVNSASANTLALGWMLGYGVEFAFTQHWTAKAEFDWLDFGHKSVTLSDGTAINTYERAAQAKVGVNYKF